jgi:hypothetical protein
VLASLGVTADDVRAQVVQIVGPGDEVVTGRIPVIGSLGGQPARTSARLTGDAALGIPARACTAPLRLALFAAALGVGILVGWAIWGH